MGTQIYEKMHAKIIFVIGVSGVGKSTIGSLLSKAYDIPFFDGDDYHPEHNITKMSQGKALNDTDRLGWLEALNHLAVTESKKKGCVIACSALKQSYRDRLQSTIEDDTDWVFLHGSPELITERINQRKGHFMTADLLKSQFDTLEEPEDAINIDIRLSTDQIIKAIKKERMHKSEFGLFGLGVMGKSLSRNLADKGFKLSLFNRHVDKVEENVAANFIKEHDELSSARGYDNVEQFVHSLQTPRKSCLWLMPGASLIRS